MTLGRVHSLICFLTDNYFISDPSPPLRFLNFWLSFRRVRFCVEVCTILMEKYHCQRLNGGGGLVAPSCLTLL